MSFTSHYLKMKRKVSSENIIGLVPSENIIGLVPSENIIGFKTFDALHRL